MLAVPGECTANVADAGVRRIRYPLNFSDQFYHLRVHIDLVRQRLFPKTSALRIAAE